MLNSFAVHGTSTSNTTKLVPKGSSCDGSINTDITFGWSIEGDMFKHSDIATRNAPASHQAQGCSTTS